MRISKYVLTIIIGIIISALLLGILIYNTRSKKDTYTLQKKEPMYNTDQIIADTLEKVDTEIKSQELSSVKTMEPVISLTFDGLAGYTTMLEILDILEENNITAAFFVEGVKSAENDKIVRAINDRGHFIGNYGLFGKKNIDAYDDKQIVKEIAVSQKIIENIINENVTYYKGNAVSYTDFIKSTTMAVNIPFVIKSNTFLNVQSFKNKEETFTYFQKLKLGQIVTIKLNGVLDEFEYKQANINNEEERQSGHTLSQVAKDKKDLDIVDTVEWIIDSIQRSNIKVVNPIALQKYNDDDFDVGNIENIQSMEALKNITDDDIKRYVELREKNSGKKSKIISSVNTYEGAVSYVFSGLSDKEVVKELLNYLDHKEIIGSFFVTGIEVIRYPETVRLIADRGHEIYNGGYGKNYKNFSVMSYEDISYEIEKGREILKSFLGKGFDDKYFMPRYGDCDEDVLEAAYAFGYDNIITYNRNAINSKYKNSSADEIMDKYYNNTSSLLRGDIVYYKLDYLTNSSEIIKLVEQVTERLVYPSKFRILPINRILNSDFVYEFSKPRPLNMRNEISRDELLKLMERTYIGCPYMASPESIEGFTQDEIDEYIDISGLVNTCGKKEIFLTFDDWGSDVHIQNILDVLRKHNIKATFFIRVGSDSVRPGSHMVNHNMLRSIAMEGHDIGNHTFTHMTLNVQSDEEINALKNNILAAYNELERYLGGTSSNKLFFRPPTLAVTKKGIETVYKCGYKYIVNGNFSTHDYQAESVLDLKDELLNENFPPGSIVVMHMSDNAKYTASALDEVIPQLKKRGYSFSKLSSYLK